jgi:hypothetical protein
MYNSLSNLILGFHGCDKETYDNVLYKHECLKTSINNYDWLGNGIYFWENDLSRAIDWANSKFESGNAYVIGAVLNLGYCLNLTDFGSSKVLKNGYEILCADYNNASKTLPKNRGKKGNDILLRDLDCAVIQRIHQFNKELNKKAYDSVRGVFTEGNTVYENSGFMEKTHIQICVTNPNCIKGYFRPLLLNEKYDRV